jgi:hypothetical protein
MPKNFVLRRARKGQGLLPPNPKRWEQEHNGLDLRHELDLPLDERLSPEAAFSTLEEVYIAPHGDLGLPEVAAHFRNSAPGNWSGMCIPYSDLTLVVFNDSHPPRRIRATLMEEFFHLWLGHKPTRLRVFSNGESKRDFDPTKESEAYGSGAAALVPYKPLRAMLEDGRSVRTIADHYLVSEQLVDFRIHISKLARLRRG